MNVFNSKWVTGVGILSIVVLGFLVVQRLPGVQKTKQEISRIQNDLTRLEEEQEELEQKKEYYESEAYLEYQARLKLHYKKADEQVVYVYRSIVPQESGVTLDKPASHLQQWWDYLMRD